MLQIRFSLEGGPRLLYLTITSGRNLAYALSARNPPNSSSNTYDT